MGKVSNVKDGGGGRRVCDTTLTNIECKYLLVGEQTIRTKIITSKLQRKLLGVKVVCHRLANHYYRREGMIKYSPSNHK